MVYQAKSTTRKRWERVAKREEQIQEAVVAYRAEQTKPVKERKGLRKIAEEFGVNHNTLNAHYKGVESISVANQEKQKLSIQEEEILVKLIITSADWGVPLTQDDIKCYANELIKQIHSSDSPGVGKN